jgi:hypothetical protein
MSVPLPSHTRPTPGSPPGGSGGGSHPPLIGGWDPPRPRDPLGRGQTFITVGEIVAALVADIARRMPPDPPAEAAE